MKNKVYTGAMQKAVPFSGLKVGQMFKPAGMNEVWIKTDPIRSGGVAVSLEDGHSTMATAGWAVIPFRPGTTIHIDQGE